MRRTFTAIAVACGVFAVQAFAQTSTQEFATKVAISDMFEIQSSKIATQKGNANIKAFAERMLADHTKTSQELKEVASKAKVKLPTTMDDVHQKKLTQLQKLSGDEFNTAYASIQIQAHEDAVKLFESYSGSGENAELKTWAAKTLPALREHLQHAQKLK
jgi:putative membrane protein